MDNYNKYLKTEKKEIGKSIHKQEMKKKKNETKSTLHELTNLDDAESIKNAWYDIDPEEWDC